MTALDAHKTTVLDQITDLAIEKNLARFEDMPRCEVEFIIDDYTEDEFEEFMLVLFDDI